MKIVASKILECMLVANWDFLSSMRCLQQITENCKEVVVYYL